MGNYNNKNRWKNKVLYYGFILKTNILKSIVL